MIDKVVEHNKNGKLKHYLDGTGFEQWWEYYDNGKLSHHKTSRGDERYLKYGNGIIYIYDIIPERGHFWYIYYEEQHDLIPIPEKDYEKVENGS